MDAFGKKCFPGLSTKCESFGLGVGFYRFALCFRLSCEIQALLVIIIVAVSEMFPYKFPS